MDSNIVKEYSVFPNGERVRNDKLVNLLQVVYDLLETPDSQAVLFNALYKAKYGNLSAVLPDSTNLEDVRTVLASIGLLTKGGKMPRDVKNFLVYLDEANNLYSKLFAKLTVGKRFNHKLTLSLDQYDPNTNKIYRSKDSWKSKTDDDFRRGIGEKNWQYLNQLRDMDE